MAENPKLKRPTGSLHIQALANSLFVDAKPDDSRRQVPWVTVR
jgi:hypothetical protein